MGMLITVPGADWSASLAPGIVNYDGVMQDLSGGLFWSTADAANLAVDGSNNVSLWSDRLGLADFSQGAAARQPAFVSGETIGSEDYGVIELDKTAAEFMSWLGSFPTGADYTKIAIVKKTVDLSTAEHLLSDTLTPYHYMQFLDNGGYKLRAQNGSGDFAQNQTAIPGLDTWMLVEAAWDESTGTIYVSVDGGSWVSATTAGATNTSALLKLGAGGSVGGLNAMVREVALSSECFALAEFADERALYLQRFASLYGIGA
ncbi:hypothetical protein [Novosphingobium sp. MBES04]|uniref:hypothetical protein n=1 Tax=Novosphingobium sp. MBES04 TaxID=1206458 RepID=UPI00057E0095|nr:hypothetical protein [Novosphingobium sp. MBES04]GAM06317.1 hypothetical protein MBENS4_3314 [Novosphingobium sp. MBES04]